MGGGPWNNTRGHSLCLQVEVVVTGGPWNNTRGRSLCLQVGVVVGGVSCFYLFGEPLKTWTYAMLMYSLPRHFTV